MSDAVKTKKKRSLRKKSFVASSRRSPINVDVSKPDVDEIFSNLASGSLPDPNAALREVYALAIESVAQAFVDGLSSLCLGILDTARSDDFLDDNPLAPWIRKYLPSGDIDGAALRETLSEKIQASKATILSSLTQAMTGAHGCDGVATSHEDDDLIEHGILRHRNMHCPMSQARIEALIDQLQSGAPREERAKTYKIMHTPRTYRFSFGTADAKKSRNENDDAAKVDENRERDASDGRIAEEDLSIDDGMCRDCRHEPSETIADFDETDAELDETDGEQSESLAERRCRELVHSDKMTMPVSESIKSMQSLFAQGQKASIEKFSQLSAATTGISQAIEQGDGWIAQIGASAEAELSGVLQDIALQVTDAVLAAYIAENPEHIASLSNLLRDDPRVIEDNSLSAFIESLESSDNAGDDGVEDGECSVTNDDLSRAFAKLLADPDLDLD